MVVAAVCTAFGPVILQWEGDPSLPKPRQTVCGGVRGISDLRLRSGEACIQWLTSEVIATPLLHRVSRQYCRAGVIVRGLRLWGAGWSYRRIPGVTWIAVRPIG